MARQAFLTVNAGSSSLKLGLFDADLNTLAMGHADRIGQSEATITIKSAEGAALPQPPVEAAALATQPQALRTALGLFEAAFPGLEILAVGHRIVHGGPKHGTPERATEAVLADLARLTPFAPLHQPHNLAGVRAAMEAFAGVPQVLCFDTAFHRGHPFVADIYAIPREFYDKGVRRYGFHGLSYAYIDGELARTEPELRAGRVVVAHLGSGASMCAMMNGQSMCATLGFSALSGLPMGTRSGDIDPGIVLYLMDQEGMSPQDISDLLYKKSGLLGISGLSNDMRVLEASDDPRAKEAIDYFCFRIKREVGAMAAAMGGIDALVFCGGIGERSAQVRAKVCARLDWLGIEIDAAANARNAREISTGKVAVRVIPTNEEIVIARAAKAIAG